MSPRRFALLRAIPFSLVGAAFLMPAAALLSGCEDAKNAASEFAAEKFKSEASKSAETACVAAVGDAEGKRGFRMKGLPSNIVSSQLGKTQFQIRVSYIRIGNDPAAPGKNIATESVCETQGNDILNIQMGMTTDDWDRELKAIAEKNRQENPEPAAPPEPAKTAASEQAAAAPVYDAATTERINKVMSEIYARYPAMDAKSVSFNQRLFESVVMQQKEYVNRGRPPDQAWRLAAYDVARAVALYEAPQEPAAASRHYDPRVLPSNAHWIIEGTSWACNAGFYPNALNQECLAVQIPENGILDASGRSWQCRLGYVQHGPTCVASAAGAGVTSVSAARNPRCAAGFKAVDGRCEALPPAPDYARYDIGADNWHCIPGYYLLKGRCVSDGTH